MPVVGFIIFSWEANFKIHIAYLLRFDILIFSSEFVLRFAWLKHRVRRGEITFLGHITGLYAAVTQPLSASLWNDERRRKLAKFLLSKFSYEILPFDMWLPCKIVVFSFTNYLLCNISKLQHLKNEDPVQEEIQWKGLSRPTYKLICNCGI